MIWSSFFFFFAWGYSFISAPFVEKTVNFSTELPLHLFWKSIDHMFVGLFVDSVLLLICMSILFLVPHYLVNSSSVVNLEIRWCKSPSYIFLLPHYFGYSSSFALSYKCNFSLSIENPAETFDCNWVDSLDSF